MVHVLLYEMLPFSFYLLLLDFVDVGSHRTLGSEARAQWLWLPRARRLLGSRILRPLPALAALKALLVWPCDGMLVVALVCHGLWRRQRAWQISSSIEQSKLRTGALHQGATHVSQIAL